MLAQICSNLDTHDNQQIRTCCMFKIHNIRSMLVLKYKFLPQESAWFSKVLLTLANAMVRSMSLPAWCCRCPLMVYSEPENVRISRQNGRCKANKLAAGRPKKDLSNLDSKNILWLCYVVFWGGSNGSKVEIWNQPKLETPSLHIHDTHLCWKASSCAHRPMCLVDENVVSP